MHYIIDNILLRNIEIEDLKDFYLQKNDPEVSSFLGGFSTGYSIEDIKDWYDYHRKKKDELILSMIDRNNGLCIGHVGLYNIDYRIRIAEFAIMIGDKSYWDKGIGSKISRNMINYGFDELNLNRISSTFLSDNYRSIKMCEKLGFKKEGELRKAQFKNGVYKNILLLGLLKEEFTNA